MRTEELTLPGFEHDTYPSAHPLFATSAAYADLGPELAERGLRCLNTDLPRASPCRTARPRSSPATWGATVAELERLAPGDGTTFARMMEAFGAHAQHIFPLFGLDLSSPAARPFLRALMVNSAGTGPSQFASEFLPTARDVLAQFKSPVFPALAAPWVLHLGRTPEGANSGPWVPLTLMAL